MPSMWPTPVAVCALACLAIACSTQPVRGDEAEVFQRLLGEKTAPLVTVRFVLKVKNRAGDSDAERESTGVMLDPGGLILCSNSDFALSRVRRDATATPTEIKVLIGDDTEGVPAKLVARDSELDLAWLQISESSGQPFSAIVTTDIADADIGEQLYSVSKLDKFFDRAPAVRVARISAITSKPRRVYLPGAQLSDFGLPVYNAAGKLVGFTSVLRPEREELDPSGRLQAAAVILPVADVLSATQRAREVAVDAESDE